MPKRTEITQLNLKKWLYNLAIPEVMPQKFVRNLRFQLQFYTEGVRKIPMNKNL